MKRAVWLAVVGLGVFGLALPSAGADDKEKKGAVVEIDDLKAAPPAEWKAQDPGKMRYLQYKLPKVEGDADDAELVIYKGFGGTAEQNIARWKGSFKPPEGKELDDVAKLTKLEIAGRKATYLDVTGTYTAPAFAPGAKADPKPDSRMLAVHFEGKGEIYHFKLVGPAKTVTQYKAGFDEFLKSLKESK